MTEYCLRSCVWELTLACPFRCRHCGSRAGTARENELTTEECLSVAKQLAEAGCERVSLIGGEVFLREDWDVIARALTGEGIRVSVITNGFRMTDEILSRLRAVRIRSVAVSVDGPEQIHDRYRQPGSFTRCRDTVAKLIRSGIPAAVITTLNEESAAHLTELYTCLRTWKLSGWQLQACSPMGNASEGAGWAFDFGAVLSFVAETAPTAPFPMGVADNIGYFTDDEGILRGDLNGDGFFPGCSAGISSIGIDSVGNVRGCESMYDERFIEGNLRKKSLRSIWEADGAFAYNRDFTEELLTGNCRGCPYGSFCGGGCRSYNWFTHKKLYESPACARLHRIE